MTKILYLIASHANSEQIQRLVKSIKIGSPSSQILIHHDYSSSYLDPSYFSHLDGVHVFEDYVPVTWSEFSQVEIELRCFNWLINNSIEFDWLIFLSGQDYPITPLNKVEEYLEACEYDALMDFFPADNPRAEPTKGGLGGWTKRIPIRRYYYQWYKITAASNVGRFNRVDHIAHKLFNHLINDRQPFIKLMLNKCGFYLGIRCSSLPFTPDFKCYVGSNWHTFSYRCVLHIYEFLKKNPAIIRHYQRSVHADESIFQTILLNNPEFKVLNDNKRYIKMKGRHPIILRVQDFDALVSSGQHFARKFDLSVDAKVFDLLDQHLLAGLSKTKVDSDRWHSAIETSNTVLEG